MSGIVLEGLGVSFGGRPILKDLTADLSGSCIGLLGPNGAGKTTLIHTLLGFHQPSSGGARVLGFDIVNQSQELRAQVGYMPERDSFITGMSGVRFVRLMAELSGIPSRVALERTHEAMFYVGLGEARYRPLESYSLGMKQLAKLAQALVHGPRLLFLDEPTNGLDPPARRRMLGLIRDIRDSGRARIILSSHLLRDVEESCDQALVLKDGRIAALSDLEAERRANRKFLEIELHGDLDGFATKVEDLGVVCAREGRRLKVVLPDSVPTAALYRIAAAEDWQILRLSAKRHSLEDIFLEAMGEIGR